MNLTSVIIASSATEKYDDRRLQNKERINVLFVMI